MRGKANQPKPEEKRLKRLIYRQNHVMSERLWRHDIYKFITILPLYSPLPHTVNL